MKCHTRNSLSAGTKTFPPKNCFSKAFPKRKPRFTRKLAFICYPTGQSSSLCYLIGLRSLYVDRGLFKTTQVFSQNLRENKSKLPFCLKSLAERKSKSKWCVWRLSEYCFYCWFEIVIQNWIRLIKGPVSNIQLIKPFVRVTMRFASLQYIRAVGHFQAFSLIVCPLNWRFRFKSRARHAWKSQIMSPHSGRWLTWKRDTSKLSRY